MVTLDNALAQDKEYTVKVKMNGETKEFKFTFGIAVTGVSLDEKTYDDDTVGQKLSFKVNGEAATADTEWLRQAGYTVNFVAVDSTNKAATIFENGSTGASTSATGLLKGEVPVGEYTVEIQILKGGKVVVSDESKITVSDLESTTTSISSVELLNGGVFYMNSSTLVAGETATIDGIVGNAAGKTDVYLPLGLAEVTSSNNAIVSVSSSAGVHTLAANGPGTATITVKIGSVTKTVNLTVTNDVRKVSKITPSETNVKLVQGVYRSINVRSYDQYGDPIAVATGNTTVTEDLPKDAAGNEIVTIGDLAGISDADFNGKIAGGDTEALDNQLVTQASNGKHADLQSMVQLRVMVLYYSKMLMEKLLAKLV